MKLLQIIMATAIVLSGCDDDSKPGSEFNGLYELVVYQSKSDCESSEWTDLEITEPYFYLEAQNFLGYNIIAWMDCSDADESSCEDSVSLTDSFAKKDGVWQQYMTSSSYSEGNCYLSYTRAVLETTETGISWESVSKSGMTTVDNEDDCEPELAEEIEDELECEEIEYFEADSI
ncbi:MAG: hypothetical protein PF689_03970 [Deltaproteobacteria bacterium]|jgi:hypothetical protein|nr:hypothetical protein [Deltaproteobacteria bacterium]